jgi:hypothetical protein
MSVSSRYLLRQYESLMSRGTCNMARVFPQRCFYLDDQRQTLRQAI